MKDDLTTMMRGKQTEDPQIRIAYNIKSNDHIRSWLWARPILTLRFLLGYSERNCSAVGDDTGFRLEYDK